MGNCPVRLKKVDNTAICLVEIGQHKANKLEQELRKIVTNPIDNI